MSNLFKLIHLLATILLLVFLNVLQPCKSASRLMNRASRSNQHGGRQRSKPKLRGKGFIPSENFLRGQHGSLRPNMENINEDPTITITNNNPFFLPQSIAKTRNFDKLLIAFDNQCLSVSNTENEIHNYINQITSMYSCLHEDLNRTKNIYHNTYVDEWHAFLLIDNTNINNNNNNNIDCLNENEIDYDDYCISYIDYEFVFEYDSRNRLQCITDATISSDPHSSVNRWHLTSIDGTQGTSYTHVDTAS